MFCFVFSFFFLINWIELNDEFITNDKCCFGIISRLYVTPEVAMLVGRSVGNLFELRAIAGPAKPQNSNWIVPFLREFTLFLSFHPSFSLT